MRTTLSAYKYKRLGAEALKNSLRLLDDAILLYSHGSYPSSYQLSVLALEEYAKACWVEHVYYASITNNGLPDESEEQPWLLMLYSHPEKQYSFFARHYHEFPPKLIRVVKSGELERKKQSAVYVGFERKGRKIDVNSRLSTPTRISEPSARQMISLVVQEFIDIYDGIDRNELYFGIKEMDAVIRPEDHPRIYAWPHRTTLKSRRNHRAHGIR